MKYMILLLSLLTFNFAWAEDKNTSEEHPTASYHLDIGEEYNRVIVNEFTPKGDKDTRCILVGKSALACYKAGKE